MYNKRILPVIFNEVKTNTYEISHEDKSTRPWIHQTYIIYDSYISSINHIASK